MRANLAASPLTFAYRASWPVLAAFLWIGCSTPATVTDGSTADRPTSVDGREGGSVDGARADGASLDGDDVVSQGDAQSSDIVSDGGDGGMASDAADATG